MVFYSSPNFIEKEALNQLGHLESLQRRNILFHDLVNGEAGRLLTWWELLERFQEFPDIRLSRHQKEGVIEISVPVSVRGDARPFVTVLYPGRFRPA